MAETPEEIAARITDDERGNKHMTDLIASALRAQYVAGLEAGLYVVQTEEEGPHGQDYQLGDVEDFRKRCVNAIRELAEQAKAKAGK